MHFKIFFCSCSLFWPSLPAAWGQSHVFMWAINNSCPLRDFSWTRVDHMEMNCVNYYPVEPKHMLFSRFIIPIYKRTPFTVWIAHFFSAKNQGLNLNHNALMWALFFQAPFSSLIFCLSTIRGYMTKFFLPPQTAFFKSKISLVWLTHRIP